MLVIANNLSFKNKDFVKAAHAGDKTTMSMMAEVLKKAGADMININLSLDGDGDAKYMAAAVEAVGKAGLPLSVDSRDPAALEAAVGAASGKLILNYVSGQDSDRAAMDRILKLAADKKTDVVLYAMKKGTPADADERLSIISELMERANAAGVENGRIIIDPVILHLGGGIGQEQAVAVQETLYELHELVDPPVRSTCWLANVSAGAPHDLRPVINGTFLAMLAGLGLWSVYMDVLNREMMRTVRLVRALKNEAVYSAIDANL